ncbi:MAG: hypothetical protein QXK06_02020 [Candidatus Diapherotrites archaeon]
MEELQFLSYLGKSPFREALSCLAREEGLNKSQIMDLVSKKSASASLNSLLAALEELELNGFIVGVNGCYHFQKEWFKEFVLFLEEFEASREEMDLCEQMLGQDILKAFYAKKQKKDF